VGWMRGVVGKGEGERGRTMGGVYERADVRRFLPHLECLIADSGMCDGAD